MASIFTRIKEKIQVRYTLDVSQVVQEYESLLQYGLVTSSSFQDILDGKLNKKRRALQLIMMLLYCLYEIPRYCFVTLLYFQDEKTRLHYQYILADYAEEMGMLGRTFNVCYIIYIIGLFVNAFVILKFEAHGSLEFLTDWLKRVPQKPSIEDEDGDKIIAPGQLNNNSKLKLISGLHYKTILARIMARNLANSLQLFELIAFSLFIYKRKPSFCITCVGLWNCLSMLACIKFTPYHYNSLYLSYVVTTDYFKLVINNMKRKVEDLKLKEITNENVTSLLNDYDVLMNDFKNYNRVLKPLLGNLVHFYMFGLTTTFFAFTIKTEFWMMAIMIVAAGGYALIVLVTGVYVSQLYAEVIELHNSFASLCARQARGKGVRLSLKCMFRLKHVVQELGSLETDGQFVIGLRDGEGPATSRMEIFDLTMETVINVLMILTFVDGMEGF